MRMKIKLLLSISLMSFVGSISAKERIILLNEGLWQSDNGKVTYFEDGRIVSNQWFRDVNGRKLGDTPDDIIQVNDNLIAIAVNWSNIIQFIDADGRAIAATEDVPNNRKLATDGDYVYVTSYAHEVGINGGFMDFTRGYVAKIDVRTFRVVAACEVGYEPEGIAWHNGYLFVANTGGYAYSENHDYETTVSVIDASTMQPVRTVDTKQINLYGKMSKSGKYLCINSPGDYYEIHAATIILDCEAVLDNKPDSDCYISLPYAATYNCVNSSGNFFAIGSRYSYYTGDYEFNYVTINPEEVLNTHGKSGIQENGGFPGTVLNDLKNIAMPYGIYVNPYTGYIYATDAGEFVSGGSLYQWSPEGKLLGKHPVYINPAHFLALKDASGIETVESNHMEGDDVYFNLQGIKVANPQPGHIYIRNGEKIIYHN